MPARRPSKAVRAFLYFTGEGDSEASRERSECLVGVRAALSVQAHVCPSEPRQQTQGPVWLSFHK